MQTSIDRFDDESPLVRKTPVATATAPKTPVILFVPPQTNPKPPVVIKPVVAAPKAETRNDSAYYAAQYSQQPGKGSDKNNDSGYGWLYWSAAIGIGGRILKIW